MWLYLEIGHTQRLKVSSWGWGPSQEDWPSYKKISRPTHLSAQAQRPCGRAIRRWSAAVIRNQFARTLVMSAFPGELWEISVCCLLYLVCWSHHSTLDSLVSSAILNSSTEHEEFSETTKVYFAPTHPCYNLPKMWSQTSRCSHLSIPCIFETMTLDIHPDAQDSPSSLFLACYN
jgi:hypothetical protein